MALTVDGIPVSGSVGHVTYSRNRYGSYRRSRSAPVNPNSSRQTAARANFSTAVEMWGSTLTGAQRLAWNNWAVATPWLNKAGEVVHLTGQAAWIRHCSAWLAAGFTVAGDWLTPPVQNDVGAINIEYPSSDPTAEWDIATNELDLTLSAPAGTNSSGLALGSFLIEATPGQNAGVTFPGSRWSSISQTNPAFTWVANQIVIAGVTLDLPWTWAVGQRIWLRVRGIGTNTGATERRVTTQQIVGPFILTTPTP